MGPSAGCDRTDPQSGLAGPAWRASLSFLPSEAATVGLALWVAARLYYASDFSPWTWAAALAGWTAFALGSVALERWAARDLGTVLRGLALAVGAAWVASAARALAGNLSWTQAGALGICLALALAGNRWLLALSVGRASLGPGEGVRWALLQGLGAYAVHPYVHCALAGAGDAYSYGLTLADFVGQLRAGVWPVFVGQTEFAFNGNIHTLRTAPYFEHLGGLLDVLTLRTLPAYALANLAILASAVAGTVGTYAALRLYSRRWPWTALALAGLYILSPAFLALLYEGDMVPTYMTAPMIPWLSLGLALAAERPDDWKPWLIQAAALAGLWWAHPPIALWASALCAGAWLAILLRRGITRARFTRIATAALLFSALALYEFVSVLNLRLPPGPETQAGLAWNMLDNVGRNWRAAFAPLGANGTTLLGDVQLGYSLLACLLVGVLVPHARKGAVFLFVCILAFLVFLVPVPGVTPWLWSHVPRAALHVTNAWPMQRLYPISAGLAVFAAWAGLSELRLGRRGSAAVALALVTALGWSAREAQKLFTHAALERRSPEQSALLYGKGNVTLTRVSYMYFGYFPEYFSNGPMDPLLETRLLDLRSLEAVADGASRRPGAPAVPLEKAELKGLDFGIAQLKIPMRPLETSILRFDFLGLQPAGELQVTSRSMFGLYPLPTAGNSKSFGAGPRNGRAIVIRNESDRPDLVSVTFVPNASQADRVGTAETFARVTSEPLMRTGQVIELRSLLPFHAAVESDRAAILETPKMDVPGYRARLNGRLVETVRTPDGLVGVPVEAGASDVRVDYPGSTVLRWTYALGLASWMALLSGVLCLPIVDRPGRLRARLLGLRASYERYLPRTLLTGAIGGALIFGGPWIWRHSFTAQPGARRLVVMLPLGRAGQSEPLVETGRTGAGDVVYVSFLGGNRISVGRDKWSQGASVSAPFDVDFSRSQTIEIAMGSLARRPFWSRGKHLPFDPGVSVKWNGRQVLSAPKQPYPRGSNPVEIGANPIGASTCGAVFTGRMLEASEIDPGAP